MRVMKTCVVFVLVAVGCAGPAAAQSVKHIQTPEAGIASGVWVDDMLYLSGQLPTPMTPADRDKGTPAVYGNTQAQAESVFAKIQGLLKAQGLDMNNVVMMRVYMTADPATSKLDFAGMNAAWEAWVIPGQTPARATIEATLANPAYKVEIMCIAAL